LKGSLTSSRQTQKLAMKIDRGKDREKSIGEAGGVSGTLADRGRKSWLRERAGIRKKYNGKKES